MPRAGEADANPPVTADDHLLDRAVHRQVADVRWLPFGHERAPLRTLGEPAGGEETPKRERVEGMEGGKPPDVTAIGRPAELQVLEDLRFARRLSALFGAEPVRERGELGAQPRAG